MFRHLFLALLLAMAGSVESASFRIATHQFTLPEGFTIEAIAGTNLVERPVEADFDEEGRLYVTEASGSNDKVEKQLADKPHRVLRLTDTNGDGRFDERTIFADRMMLPQGALWRHGSLYVSAPPSIWKLTDTNSDGVADVRVEWLAAQTLTGCANDLHGPYAGPDGWIYWCKGAFARQTHKLPSGAEFTTRAAHIFRARPDGRGVEPVLTGGMDNPVGLAFTATGERILTCTFFQHPGGGNRDGLIHSIHGGVYGKIHDVIDEHPRTGDVMPVLTHLGPSAPAGIARYESDAFGPTFRDSLFVCSFNLHKVTRHELLPKGATFETKDEDFLISDNADFHPTDVLEDADGSLVVIDTGGWYKLCCPTSQLYKPDVLGGIYRIRRTGAPRATDPRGSKLAWSNASPEELASRLNDSRPAVRTRAVDELGRRGDQAVASLANTLRNGSVEARRNAVWALARIESASARAAARPALEDTNISVRLAAWQAASAWRDTGAVSQALGQLKSGAPHEQRLAAELLGRVQARAAVPSLLQLAERADDRVLEHAAIFALIEIGDADATSRALTSAGPLATRAALLALEQMPGGRLAPEQILPLLGATNDALRETALWICTRHSEWGGKLAEFLRDEMKGTRRQLRNTADLGRLLSRFARNAAVQAVLINTLTHEEDASRRVLAVQALAQSGLKEAPSAWVAPIPRQLASTDSRLLQATIEAMQRLSPPKSYSEEWSRALVEVAERIDVSPAVRLAAAATVPGGIRQLSEPLFSRLVATLVGNEPLTQKGHAATALAQARLSDSRLLELAGHVKRLGPIELPKVLPVFARSTNGLVGQRVLESLESSPAASSLRPEIVRHALTNMPVAIQQRADVWLQRFNADAAQQARQIDDLLKELRPGDIRRGQALFNSAKTGCSACHAIGYLGGQLGPDLTRIGQIRSERDLIEALLFPNASFVRSYEPTIVLTKSGDEISGILKQEGAELLLATGPQTEQRIPRSDITHVRPGTVSLMPSGLVEQLSREELADLLAFLKATRW